MICLKHHYISLNSSKKCHSHEDILSHLLTVTLFLKHVLFKIFLFTPASNGREKTWQNEFKRPCQTHPHIACSTSTHDPLVLKSYITISSCRGSNKYALNGAHIPATDFNSVQEGKNTLCVGGQLMVSVRVYPFASIYHSSHNRSISSLNQIR